VPATARREDRDRLEPIDNGKGLFRSLIAGAGQTLIETFEYLAERKTVARVIRHPLRPLLSARITLSPEEGKGAWIFTRLGNDVYVVAGSFAYNDPRVESVAGDGLLQFCFNLSGDLTMAIGRTERLRINRPSLLLCAQARGVVVKEWIPAGSNERFVAIVVRPQFLIDHFFGSAPEVPPLLRNLMIGTRHGLEYVQLPLDPKLLEIASKFFTEHVGVAGLVYAEAITLELLCSAIESVRTVSHDTSTRPGERQLRGLHAARAFLTKQLAPAPTARQIARTAGLNVTTLKRGFKLVFGETPCEFSVRCRMEHALTLLRDRGRPIASVASAVGYRHQASFATAFRRHFGIRPREARQGPLRLSKVFGNDPS
jgi:AraC-like DNA-binding protein